MLSHINDGTSCDGRQNRVGLRYHQCPLLIHEDGVGSPGLLYVGSGGSIQIQVLGKALSMCHHGSMKAHGIVQAGLDSAGAVGCCTVKVRYLQCHGCCAALVVGADGCGKDTELILICRLHTNDRTGSKLIGAKIEAGAGAIGRYPVLIAQNRGIDGLQELLLRERRHFQSLGRLIHTLCVKIRAEANDAAVLPGIGLHALEYLLAVLQNTG